MDRTVPTPSESCELHRQGLYDLHAKLEGFIFVTIYVGRHVQWQYVIGVYANELSKPPRKVIHQAR